MEVIKKNLNANRKLIPVILSGGTGSRLWPLSRECFPKQYLNLDDDSKYSLLQNTFLRLKTLDNLDDPIIVCNDEHRFIVAEQMRGINIKPKKIILEPVGKNTAPAIALAALMASNSSDDPLLLILSADHIIKNKCAFIDAINEAKSFAELEKLVTFGILPTKPETGYGYIESTHILTNKVKVSPIKQFVEKPSYEIAKKYLQDRHFSWNSGIFLFKTSKILNELNKYEPSMLKICRRSIENSYEDLNFQRIKSEIFNKCKNIPIDIAVMEKTKDGVVLSLDAGWSDIGNWSSVWENSTKDSKSNVLKGKTRIKNSENCYLRSEERLLVGIGLKDIIAIETNDAILISNKESSQDIKHLVSDLNKISFVEGKQNRKMFRPWGNYTSVVNGETWQVKKLEIKPKASLSLQMHHYRSEHWVIVSGTAKVEINKNISILNANESIYVPLGAKHRLSNPGEVSLIIIEVQSGNYLGEDDILRFEDVYGRK